MGFKQIESVKNIYLPIPAREECWKEIDTCRLKP